MNELINKARVTNTYTGLSACACGCNGTYAEAGATVTRQINEVNKAIADGEQVETYSTWSDKVVYEYPKPNGPVVRICIKKEA